MHPLLDKPLQRHGRFPVDLGESFHASGSRIGARGSDSYGSDILRDPGLPQVAFDSSCQSVGKGFGVRVPACRDRSPDDDFTILADHSVSSIGASEIYSDIIKLFRIAIRCDQRRRLIVSHDSEKMKRCVIQRKNSYLCAKIKIKSSNTILYSGGEA